jgi:hypothetical protein
LTQNKGPPVGTPRPQPIVAQWAITSPRPTADKLTTIASDNELDDDEDKYKSSKSNNRIVSPHPKLTNRITHDKRNQLTTINKDDDDDFKRSSRQKRHNQLNGDDDNDEYPSRRSPSVQKSRSRLSDDDENEFGDNRKKTDSREQDRYTKQRYDRNNDNDDEDFNQVSSRRTPSSTRKTAGGDSSHRSHSRTNGNGDDDLR